MKPLAILSYHKESVYSLSFAHIYSQENNDNENGEKLSNHFVVAGGKDHRISLWEIY